MGNVRGICCSKPGVSNHEPWKHKRQNQPNGEDDDNDDDNNNNNICQIYSASELLSSIRLLFSEHDVISCILV
jgi:hypothetical protein